MSEQSATECAVRAVDSLRDDNLEIITIVAMTADGLTARLFSNARSEAEMYGMLHMGLYNSEDVAGDEEEEDG